MTVTVNKYHHYLHRCYLLMVNRTVTVMVASGLNALHFWHWYFLTITVVMQHSLLVNITSVNNQSEAYFVKFHTHYTDLQRLIGQFNNQ